MNQKDLTQEIKEKVKEGVKPSDLKKARSKSKNNNAPNLSPQKVNEITEELSDPDISTPPPLPTHLNKGSEQNNSDLLAIMKNFQDKISELGQSFETLNQQKKEVEQILKEEQAKATGETEERVKELIKEVNRNFNLFFETTGNRINKIDISLTQLVIQNSDLKETINGLKKSIKQNNVISVIILIITLAISLSIGYSFFKG